MSKPWDSIRRVTDAPIGEGHFSTTGTRATVHVLDVAKYSAELGIGSSTNYKRTTWRENSQVFNEQDLRELADFATELADQLARD